MINAMITTASGGRMSFRASTLEELLHVIGEVAPSGGDINLALSSIVIQPENDPLDNPEYWAMIQTLSSED